ncbi:hypothetical protein K7432_009873 [Basidiobolus ranarum]|uniref:Uncharacterized protein n=1 Tax=Basidiobolus ranarum TaxID=34480 RepID=A0ABR2WPJ6_9FUNG
MRAYASLYCLTFAIVSIQADIAELATTSVYVIPLKTKMELEPQPFPVDISFKTMPVLLSSVLQTFDIDAYDDFETIEEEYLWMNPTINGSMEEDTKGNLVVVISGLAGGSEILPEHNPTLRVSNPPSPSEFYEMVDSFSLTSWETYGGSWKTHFENRYGGKVDIRTENIFLNERMPSAEVSDDEAYDYFLSTYQLIGAELFNPNVKEDIIFIREIEYATRMIYRYSWLAADYPSDRPNYLSLSLSGFELINKRYGLDSTQSTIGKAILRELLEKTMIPLFEHAHDGRSTISLITIPSDPLHVPFLEQSWKTYTEETLRSIWDQYGIIGLTILAILASRWASRRNQPTVCEEVRPSYQQKPTEEDHESSSDATEEELDPSHDSETDYEEETGKQEDSK